jgi:hypothetical protein
MAAQMLEHETEPNGFLQLWFHWNVAVSHFLLIGARRHSPNKAKGKHLALGKRVELQDSTAYSDRNVNYVDDF